MTCPQLDDDARQILAGAEALARVHHSDRSDDGEARRRLRAAIARWRD